MYRGANNNRQIRSCEDEEEKTFLALLRSLPMAQAPDVVLALTFKSCSRETRGKTNTVDDGLPVCVPVPVHERMKKLGRFCE